ncbi:MAG: hypothetical protein H6Q00_1871 [Holophagaceae bacterium]|nr:hypothetical protein [Holophagaceae bacterium]
MRRTLWTLSRLAFHLFMLLSAAYALIAYIPFTYQEVIRGHLVPWLLTFAHWHGGIFWVVLILTWAAGPRRTSDLAARSFFACHSLAGLALVLRPLLPGLENGTFSFAASLCFLGSSLWLAFLDLGRVIPTVALEPQDGDETEGLLLASLLAGLYVWGLFLIISRHWTPMVGAAWNLGAQLLLFLLVGVVFTLLRSVGRASRRPGPREMSLLVAIGILGLTWIIYDLIYAAMAFQGPLAWLHALLLAVMAGLAWMTLSLRPGTSGDPLTILLRPLQGFMGKGLWSRLLWGALVTLLLLGLSRKAQVFDWNFLFQKLLVILAWALGFAGCHRLVSHRARNRGRLLFASTLLVLVVLRLQAWSPWAPGLESALELQSGSNVSTKLLRELFSQGSSSQGSIYKTLQANSNISQAVRTDPVEVNHVEHLSPATGWRPHIFIVVIDSLRRDYLGAYNREVAFTPRMDAFARESVVMRNAYTRYGATGLAEPSIWVGGMLLHKQYVTPFYPMNALQKLIEIDGYRAYVSDDSILDVVVKPGPSLRHMDVGVGTQSLRLARSLGELQSHLGEAQQGPLFAYLQPQDIHVSVINREGTPPGETFPGFYAPYASRVKRMDEAFGRFIQDLKDRGIYEDSVVVLTSDHGDSLGEEGRFGHAYTLYPEIVQIPLLIHLPRRMQGLWRDPEQVAFNSDITPSLYYLLGHRPVKPSPIMGRPLFLESSAEAQAYRQEHFLLASSYGAVFGILDQAKHRLYISDGVNFADHLYSLGDRPVRKPLGASDKARYDKLILEQIQAVNTYYRFTPPR